MSVSMGSILGNFTPEQIAEIIDAVMTVRPVAVQPVAPQLGFIGDDTVDLAATTAAANLVRKKRSKKSTVSKAARSTIKCSKWEA